MKSIIKIILIVALVVSPLFSLTADAVETTKNQNYTNYRTELTAKINIFRQTQKINHLSTSSELMIAAQLKAEDMAKNEYFAHTSPTGITPWHWFYEAGYQPRLAGENLALSFSLESDIIKHWLNSPSHKKNIINNNYTETGIGT